MPRQLGRLLAFERPDGMDVELFKTHPGSGILVVEAENLICDNWWLNVMTAFAAGRTDGAATMAEALPQSLALGDGSGSAVTPHDADTQLVNETHRYALVAGVVITGPPAQSVLSFFSPSGDGAYVLKEAGLVWFANFPATYVSSVPPNHTDLPNDGTLMSHVSFTYTRGAVDTRYDYTLTRS